VTVALVPLRMIDNRLQAARLTCSPQASPSTRSWPTSNATPTWPTPPSSRTRDLDAADRRRPVHRRHRNRLLYDNGHPGLWPDDIDEWTPSKLLLAHSGSRPGV